MKKLLILTLFVSAIFADQVLVPAGENERIIKMQDGRSIRLPAGSELIRSDDGKLLIRKNAPQQATPQKQQTKQTKQAETSPDQPQDRWQLFVGGQMYNRTTTRDWAIETNNISRVSITTPSGKLVDADGSKHTESFDKTQSGFGLSFGFKDSKYSNYYQASYTTDSEFSEIFGEVIFGLKSLRFFESFEPFIKIGAGVGYIDSITDADSFAFGGGVGATYMHSRNIEAFAGFELISRKWGDVVAKAKDSAVGTYGLETKEDNEKRLFFGVRYLF